MARRRDKIIKLNLRLPAELHRTLERLAARNNRSLNTEIIERLKRGFLDEWARRLQVQALSTYKLDEQLTDMVKKALMDISDHLAKAFAEAEERGEPIKLREYPTQSKDGEGQ